LGRLEAVERRCLELVALGEPLEVPALVGLTGPDVAESLEEKGLIRVRRTDRRLHALAGHPLYAELARVRMPELRRRRLLRELADAVGATGARRREDNLRVTLWRLDAGVDQLPQALLAAFRLAWGAQAAALAERLARAALAAGGGVSAVLALVEVLVHTERWSEAGDQIQSVWHESLEDGARAQLAMRMTWVLRNRDADPDAATALLDEVEPELSDPDARHIIALQRASSLCDGGRYAEAARRLERLLANEDLSAENRADALSTLASCHAMTGRTAEAAAVAATCWDESPRWRDSAPFVHWQLGFASIYAGLNAGDLDAADAAALAWQNNEMAGLLPFARAHIRRERAGILRLRGRVAVAAETAMPQDGDSTGLRGHSYAEAAHCAALMNDLPRARSLRERIGREPSPGWAGFLVDQADVWIEAQSGLITDAVRRCLDFADRARDIGMLAMEMSALHNLVRLDAADKAVARLAEIATVHDGRLAPVIAAHATAAARPDATGLLAVADRFEELGMLLYAAEAAAQAAKTLASAGQARAASAATTRARRLADHCEGARTPALIGMRAPQLSRREYEIGRLAASGHSNKDIAARLFVSLRTVENHLHSVFTKLGVRHREELAELLG
jgi:DNA-binding CsgD family transcriptional regulator